LPLALLAPNPHSSVWSPLAIRLDPYIVSNPEFFTRASPEHARIGPDQLLILMDHVRCAAYELPFTAEESFGHENLVEMLAYLQEQGIVHREDNRWHWIADNYPANSVSLRSVSDGNFVVIDTTSGRQEVIGEVDYSSAALTLYEGAIYLIQASPWQVEKLDWTGRKAFVTQARADYYTEAIDFSRLKILDRFEHDTVSTSHCARGEVHVVRRVAGYKKIRYYTHENVGYGSVNLPDHEMHTAALWWQVAPRSLVDAFPNRSQAIDGFLGAAYALHTIACLLSMCERNDLGRAVGDGSGDWFATTDLHGRGKLQSTIGDQIDLDARRQFTPTLFLYDNYPGGIGLALSLYDMRTEVIARAAALVSECACRFGCPACVGPILASDEERRYSPKAAAIKVLALLAGREGNST
jgi:DEAD/DEAH box helicase domain-containing protein